MSSPVPSTLHVISTAHRRGAQVFAAQLDEWLRTAGHRTHTVALGPGGEAAVDAGAKLLNGVTVSGLAPVPDGWRMTVDKTEWQARRVILAAAGARALLSFPLCGGYVARLGTDEPGWTEQGSNAT